MTIAMDRLTGLPDALKPSYMLLSILIMVSIAAAQIHPSGTGFISFSTWLSLFVSALMSACIVFQFDRRLARIIWLLMEVGVSILFAIFFFISFWLCVGGIDANPGKGTPFTMAGIFCFANFLLYAFGGFLFTRIWIMEGRRSGPATTISNSGAPSYGGP